MPINKPSEWGPRTRVADRRPSLAEVIKTNNLKGALTVSPRGDSGPEENIADTTKAIANAVTTPLTGSVKGLNVRLVSPGDQTPLKVEVVLADDIKQTMVAFLQALTRFLNEQDCSLKQVPPTTRR